MAGRSYSLAVAKERQGPNFEIPSADELVNIKRGDYVKIIAEFDSPEPIRGERFWVVVESVEIPTIRGTVNNDLVHTGYHGISLGDFMEFGMSNVIDIIKKEELDDRLSQS